MNIHPHVPGTITSVDLQLERLQGRLNEPVPQRSTWARIVFPFFGLILVVLGLVFLLTPIPLAVLIVIGFPFLFCLHPAVERRARNWMVARLASVRDWVTSWRRSPR